MQRSIQLIERMFLVLAVVATLLTVLYLSGIDLPLTVTFKLPVEISIDHEVGLSSQTDGSQYISTLDDAKAYFTIDAQQLERFSHKAFVLYYLSLIYFVWAWFKLIHMYIIKPEQHRYALLLISILSIVLFHIDGVIASYCYHDIISPDGPIQFTGMHIGFIQWLSLAVIWLLILKTNHNRSLKDHADQS